MSDTRNVALDGTECGAAARASNIPIGLNVKAIAIQSYARFERKMVKTNEAYWYMSSEDEVFYAGYRLARMRQLSKERSDYGKQVLLGCEMDYIDFFHDRF
jgi:hypothetical protein